MCSGFRQGRARDPAGLPQGVPSAVCWPCVFTDDGRGASPRPAMWDFPPVVRSAERSGVILAPAPSASRGPVLAQALTLEALRQVAGCRPRARDRLSACGRDRHTSSGDATEPPGSALHGPMPANKETGAVRGTMTAIAALGGTKVSSSMPGCLCATSARRQDTQIRATDAVSEPDSRSSQPPMISSQPPRLPPCLPQRRWLYTARVPA